MDSGGTLQDLPKIEIEEFVTVSAEGGELIKSMFNQKNTTKSALCEHLGIHPRQLRRVLNQGYATNSIVIKELIDAGMPEDIEEYIEPYVSHKHRKISMPTMCDEKFANIFGYFLGDGNLERTSLKFTDARKEVLEHYKARLQNLFSISGKIVPVNGKQCFRLVLNSTDIRTLFAKVKETYAEMITRSPKSVVASFIRGFADAEGYVSKERPRITIAQKNEHLIKLTQMLLLRFGIRSSIWNGRRAQYLIIDGRDVATFTREIGLTAHDKAQLLTEWSKHCENTHTRELYPIDRQMIWDMLDAAGLVPSKYMRPRPQQYKHIHKKELQRAAEALMQTAYRTQAAFILNLIHGDMRVEKIKKIIKKPNTDPLYDLSVPRSENYIANGFIVHNSTYRLYVRKSKGNLRIAKLIDSPNLPEGEAVFTVTDEGIRDK